MTYPYRAYYAVSAAEHEAANALAAQVDPDTGGAHTYSIPLVPADGPDDAEATHYACSTLLTRRQHAALVRATGPQVPEEQRPLTTLRFSRLDAQTDLVLGTSTEGAAIGESCSFDEWLLAEDLQRHNLSTDNLHTL